MGRHRGQRRAGKTIRATDSTTGTAATVTNAYTLALFLYRDKEPEQALQVLRPVIESQPAYREAVNLFGEIMKHSQVR